MVNFPSSLDSLTNPTGTDDVSVVDHAAQHANANDILEALEAKVGADSSVVTTSHDYKLTQRVVGPGSATDNAAVRFDGTGGKTVQNSGVVIDDSNLVTGMKGLDVDSATTNDLRFRVGEAYSTDAYNLGVATTNGRKILLTSEQGTQKQAMVFADAGTTAQTALGVATDTGSGFKSRLLVRQDGNIGMGRTGSTVPLTTLHVNDEARGFDSSWLDMGIGIDYPILVEANGAKIALISANEGGHGSGIRLVECDGGTVTDSWTMGLFTSGNGTYPNQLFISNGTDKNYTTEDIMLRMNTSGQAFFTGDVSVPDEAYGGGWNGSLEVPTKNAVYDKIETISAGTQSIARTFAFMGA